MIHSDTEAPGRRHIGSDRTACQAGLCQPVTVNWDHHDRAAVRPGSSFCVPTRTIRHSDSAGSSVKLESLNLNFLEKHHDALALKEFRESKGGWGVVEPSNNPSLLLEVPRALVGVVRLSLLVPSEASKRVAWTLGVEAGREPEEEEEEEERKPMGMYKESGNGC
eukprot:768628-Hanusia_phi.AAC.20